MAPSLFPSRTGGFWRVARSAIPMVLAGLLATSAVSPASAEPLASPEAIASAVAAHIDAVAPDGGEPVKGVTSKDHLTTSTEFGEVMVGLEPDTGVSVSAELDGQQVRTVIQLPENMDLQSGVIAEDGTVVFVSEHADAGVVQDAVAVQTLEQGNTRIQTVIAGPESPHEYEYRMEGFLPGQDDRGQWAFISEDESGAFVPVEEAWAVDANGVPVQTYYEARGDALTQVIVPTTSTVYPVIADPSWQWNGGGYGMKLNRTETKNARGLGSAGGMCAIFAKRYPRVAIVCGVLASYLVLQANLAENDKPKSCLFIVAVPAPGTIWRVKC